MTRTVIIGAGQAGAQVAFSLRQWGYDGDIVLVGDEPFAPYERPPLSKEFLKGELAAERLCFKTDAWYSENGVDLKLATSARAVDRERRTVSVGDGSSIGYDHLVLASGSRPRALPIAGASLSGVFELRTIDDARRIGAMLKAGAHAVVVGAGYIGLEVAAVARTRGLEVTVLEAMPRVLARVAGTAVSGFFESEHRARGVDVRCGARLATFEGRKRLEGAVLADGTRIAADIAVIGVGIEPRDDLARACGIECNDGIVVDRDARTSDPAVFAVGDCARRPLVHYGRSGRLESVHNAIEQGKLAAAAILGRPRPAEDVPWFWSDQYDLKLQIAGLSEGHDQVVVRGKLSDRRFAAFYMKEGRLIATDAVNSPMEFMASKLLIAKRARPDPRALGNPDVSMKQIVADHPG